jgi:hypothetical protein
MDAKQAELEGKLTEILKRAADVACQIQAAKQGRGTPHYDEIELPAHEVGQRLSRMVQESRAGDVATEQPSESDCPDCGRSCHVEGNERTVHSMDGPVELVETVAHCCRCRRSFFPST